MGGSESGLERGWDQSVGRERPDRMFTVCQGTCFCAGKAEGFNRQKVLYCFGEAVIERQNMRDEESERSVEEEEVFLLQVAQMLVILVSLLAV